MTSRRWGASKIMPALAIAERLHAAVYIYAAALARSQWATAASRREALEDGLARAHAMGEAAFTGAWTRTNAQLEAAIARAMLPAARQPRYRMILLGYPPQMQIARRATLGRAIADLERLVWRRVPLFSSCDNHPARDRPRQA
jgi:hypothetical protein